MFLWGDIPHVPDPHLPDTAVALLHSARTKGSFWQTENINILFSHVSEDRKKFFLSLETQKKVIMDL